MDNPKYKYEFDLEKCCWKEVCGIKGSSKCGVLCPRYTKMHYLLGNSLLPEQWWYPKPFATGEYHVDHLAHERCFEIKSDILNFVKSGKQLIIYGKETGSGKTHMSTRLLLTYFSKIWELTAFRPRAMFIDVQKLFNESTRFDSEYIRFITSNISEVDLVIWDDLGAGDVKGKGVELLTTLINEREMCGKSNIYTTNKSPEELFDYLGERLYSRIVRSSEIIEFKSSDNRGTRV